MLSIICKKKHRSIFKSVKLLKSRCFIEITLVNSIQLKIFFFKQNKIKDKLNNHTTKYFHTSMLKFYKKFNACIPF